MATKRRNIISRFFDPFKEENEVFSRQQAEIRSLKLEKLRQEVSSGRPSFSPADVFDPTGERERPEPVRTAAENLFRTAGTTRPNRVEPRVQAPIERIPQDKPIFTRTEAISRAFPKSSTAQPKSGLTELQKNAIQGNDLDALFKATPKGQFTESLLKTFNTFNTVQTFTDPLTGLEVGRGRRSRTAAPVTTPATPGPLKPGQLRKFAQFNPLERKRVENEGNIFQKNKAIQDLEQRMIKKTEIDALASANPAEAYGLLAGAFTRLAGEVGRLTDEDITRNIVPKAFHSRLIQALTLFSTGRFPTNRIEEMKIILDIAQKAAVENFNKLADNSVTRMMALIPNADPEELKLIIAGRGLLYDPKIRYSTVEFSKDGTPGKTKSGNTFTLEETP